MSKKPGVWLLFIFEILSISLFVCSVHVFFSVAFDAADYMWEFFRYYGEVTQDLMIISILSALLYLLNIFYKNILIQSHGRKLSIFNGYVVKSIIMLLLIYYANAIHVLNNNLGSDSMMNFMPLLIILLSFITVIMNTVMLVKEVFSKA